MRSALAIAIASAALSVAARAEEDIPAELQGVGIEERPGAAVPLEVPLTDHRGRLVRLSRFFEGGKPVVLVLAYYQCPMICGLLVHGMTEGLKDLAWTAGREYRLVVLSFDPRDRASVASDKRESYLEEYGRGVAEPGFDFLVGDEESIRQVADSIGFHYRWDEPTQQYAHATGAFILTPEGKLSRTLTGISFSPGDLRLALLEASQGKLGGAWDRVLLFCFHYDPDARGYVLAARRVMTVGGALTILALGGFLALLWRRERGEAGAVADTAATRAP
jgi:protein SCO1/2